MENRIKEYRQQLRASQAEVAAVLGCRDSAVGNYENGLRNPDLDTCRAITKFFVVKGLSVTLDDVFPPEKFKKSA